jgi:NAD(P)-dependent dehydrogenase (short-subunit alcohol dehydrogenase family)
MTSSTPTLQLDDRVILITGAGSGIGAAVAKAAAAQGATVVLLDKKIPLLEQVYDEILAANHKQPALYPLDLKGASVSDYQDLVKVIVDNFGRLDGLVHCAASLGQLAPVELQDVKLWLDTLHINLTAAYLLTQACLPQLRQQQDSSIIFSSDAHQDKAYWSAYGVSKAGIEALAKQLADELETEAKVKVNSIDPGKVRTNFFSRAFPAINPENLASPESVAPSYIKLLAASVAEVKSTHICAQA